MAKIKASKFLLIALFCVSFLSYAQEDGLLLLKDADDNRIKFENHFFEALKYKAIGNYTRAIIELEKSQQLFPDETAVDFELSKNYFALNKWYESVLYIEKALQVESTNFWFLVQAKKSYLKQFNYTKAILVQQKIIEQKPALAEDLVLIYIKANEREKAQKLIDDLTKKGITSSKLRNYQKVIYNYKKTYQSATKNTNVKIIGGLVALKKEYTSNKEYPVLKEILLQELAADNFENVFLYSSEGLELFPARPMIYLMNGKALINQKKYNAAVNVLVNGLDFLIDDIEMERAFYNQLIICHNSLNDDEKSIKYQQKKEKLKK